MANWNNKFSKTVEDNIKFYLCKEKHVNSACIKCECRAEALEILEEYPSYLFLEYDYSQNNHMNLIDFKQTINLDVDDA